MTTHAAAVTQRPGAHVRTHHCPGSVGRAGTWAGAFPLPVSHDGGSVRDALPKSTGIAPVVLACAKFQNCWPISEPAQELVMRYWREHWNEAPSMSAATEATWHHPARPAEPNPVTIFMRCTCQGAEQCLGMSSMRCTCRPRKARYVGSTAQPDRMGQHCCCATASARAGGVQEM